MGRNNQQRRAAGAEPSAEDQMTLNWLYRALRLTNEGRAEEADQAFVEVERVLAHPPGRRTLLIHLNTLLREGVSAAWQIGWQPADVLRLATRDLGAVGSSLIGDAIAKQLDEFAAATVTPSWHDQLALASASVWWERSTDPLTARAAKTTGGLTALLPEVLRGVDLLGGLPQLQQLDPLPGQWRPPRHTGAGSSTTVDARLLDRVRALLAKAESTPYEAEAETFTAGAQALMARHSIDRAMLAASGPRRSGDVPTARRVGVERPYEAPKVLLLDVVARANRCRTVWSEGLGFVTVIGFAGDLDATETIFTSLLLQSSQALMRHGSRPMRGGGSRTRSFRRSFLQAFAHRIGQRLEEVTAGATAEAAAAATEVETEVEAEVAAGVAAGVEAGAADAGESRRSGPTRDLVHVLESRAAEVDETVTPLFPGLVTRSAGAASNHEGWWAGVQAADAASLFEAQEIEASS